MKAPIFCIALVVLSACGVSENKQQEADIMKSFKALRNEKVHHPMTPEIIAELKDDELEQAIVDNIFEEYKLETGDASLQVNEMSAGQRAILTTWIVEAEVGKGGLLSFYQHSGQIFAPWAEESFNAIGAGKYAALMHDANALREGKSGKQLEAYEPLDELYIALSDVEDLDQLKVNYIRANSKEFVNGLVLRPN